MLDQPTWDDEVVYNGESKATTVNVICIVFMLLTAAVLVLRMISRIFVVRAMGADDYLIICAAFCAWMFGIIILLATKNGLGRHIDTVRPHKKAYTTYQILVWASAIAYNLSLAFIKSSVIALYLRISPTNLFRRVSWAMIAIIGMQATANVITVIFQCTPVNYLWDRDISGGACIDINSFYLANAALNIATDFATYLLPMPTLWALQMPTQQKIGLCAILGLGGVACIASIVRIRYVPAMLSDPDNTYVIAEPMYWSVIETNIGILAASIPSYKILFKRYLPKLLGSSHGDTEDAHYIFSPRSTGKLQLKKRQFSMNRGCHGCTRNVQAFTNTTVTGPDEYELKGNGGGSDGGSQESIVDVPEGKIVRSTAITMVVEEEDVEDEGYAESEEESLRKNGSRYREDV